MCSMVNFKLFCDQTDPCGSQNQKQSYNSSYCKSCGYRHFEGRGPRNCEENTRKKAHRAPRRRVSKTRDARDENISGEGGTTLPVFFERESQYCL